MKTQCVNEMEEMPIPKLSVKISLPMVISMLSIALYGFVDTMFIAKISENALTAVSLVYPIQNIITAIALGTGIGLNSLLARTLGEKNESKTQKIILNGILLTIIIWILVAGIFGITAKSILQFFSANSEIVSLGLSYFYILAIFSIGTLFQIITEKILEAYGKSKESMVVQIVGTVINLILDPIFIFGLFGFPKLGMAGAAIATVTGQIIGMMIGIICIKKYNLLKLKISKENLKLDKGIIKEIYQVGLPTMVYEMVTSFILLWINKILITFSSLAVSVWGVYTKIETFVHITIYGLNYGMIPIIAYNYGAKRIDRVKECIKFFIKLGLVVTAIGTVIVFSLPTQLMNIFDVSEATINLGIPAFRILSIGFVFAGISFCVSAIFQALGNAKYSLIIKLLRKIIVSMPIIYIFKNIFGLNTIWVAFTIAEIVTMIASVLLYKKYSTKEFLIQK